MTASPLQNNIRRARQNLDLTQAQLARMVGVSQQQVAKLENGKSRLSTSQAMGFARALNVRLEEIAGSPDRGRVPVIGRLSVHDVVVQNPQYEPIEYEEAPPFSSPDVVAFAVAGDALWPMYRQGDVVFVSEPVDPQDNLGEECAVLLDDGQMLLKRLMPGSREGRYHLASMQGPSLRENAVVKECRRVEFIRRGKRTRQ